jgi:hypothetical protein
MKREITIYEELFGKAVVILLFINSLVSLILSI